MAVDDACISTREDVSHKTSKVSRPGERIRGQRGEIAARRFDTVKTPVSKGSDRGLMP